MCVEKEKLIGKLNMLEFYCSSGWMIFPLKPQKKAPLHKGWQEASTNNIKTIRGWLYNYPEINWGLYCKKSGIIVIDVDRHTSKEGVLVDGFQNFNELIKKHNINIRTDTVISISGNNGMHLLYRAPEKFICNKRELAANVHIIYNGFIVIPPSIHPNGNKYTWQRTNAPSRTPLLKLDESIINLLNHPFKNNNYNQKYKSSNNKLYQATSSLKTSAHKIYRKCNFIKHCVDDSYKLSEPEWYIGLISILCRTQEAPEIIHRWSENYHSYSYEETQSKIDQALNNSSPTSCLKIKENFNNEYCKDCFHPVSSPISLGIIY